MHCGSLSKRGHQAEGRQQKDHWEAEQTLLLTRMGVEWNVISGLPIGFFPKSPGTPTLKILGVPLGIYSNKGFSTKKTLYCQIVNAIVCLNYIVYLFVF